MPTTTGSLRQDSQLLRSSREAAPSPTLTSKHLSPGVCQCEELRPPAWAPRASLRAVSVGGAGPARSGAALQRACAGRTSSLSPPALGSAPSQLHVGRAGALFTPAHLPLSPPPPPAGAGWGAETTGGTQKRETRRRRHSYPQDECLDRPASPKEGRRGPAPAVWCRKPPPPPPRRVSLSTRPTGLIHLRTPRCAMFKN